MTVRELKDVLAWYDDDKEVLIAENNNFGASYAYSLSDDPVLPNHGIRSNWGRDVFENECLILLFDEQVGAVWESEELEGANDWDEDCEDDEEDEEC